MQQKRLLSGIFIALIALLTGALTLAQVGTVATVQQDLFLRVGPGTEWRRLGEMPAGTNIALAGRDVSGLWVRGITQNGNVGWMAANFLNVGQDVVLNLPVVDRESAVTLGAPPPGTAPVAAPASAPADAPAQPAASGGSGGVTTTVTANVNMRSGPGTSFRRVGGVTAGGAINIDGRDSGLNWVRGANSAGTVGWVSANFVNISYNEMAALPVVTPDTPFGGAVPGGGSPAAADNAQPAVAAPPPITNTTRISGFAYGGHVRGLSDQTVNAMRQAGMTWVKYQVRYTQGDSPAPVAGLINDAHAKGFRILLGVVGRPDQVNNGGYYEAYAGFVGGLAALGADAIEIWNEPNLDREWPTGQINPAMYTGLLAQSYNAIKANNPNTYVISGAMAPTGAEAAFPGRVMNDDNYLAGMVAAGALNYMDCVGAHYNEGIVGPNQNFGDPRGDDYYTRYYDGMVNRYWDITGGQRPLCFTELGYLTPEGFPPLPGNFGWAQNVTVAQQAAWLDQVVNKARNSGRVRILIVWNVDFRQYDADPMAGYAIIRPDGSCPACAALGN